MKDIRVLITQKPNLIWYTQNYENLSQQSIVEAILNYGDWNDVQEMIKILGMKQTASLFRDGIKKKRSNYHERTKTYFSRYFNFHTHA